jgi:hypothetical protein
MMRNMGEKQNAAAGNGRVPEAFGGRNKDRNAGQKHVRERMNGQKRRRIFEAG